MRRRHMQRPGLQQLEPGVIERPFDLDRHAEHVLAFAHQTAKNGGLAGFQAGRAYQFIRHFFRRGGGAIAGIMHAGLAMMLAAGFVRTHEPVAAQHDAVRHDLALGNRRAEAPCRADQHLAVGGFAQAAARGASHDQRLNQHRHRRVGGILLDLRHRSPCGRRPQRRPAGAQHGEKFCVLTHAEKALELAGKVRIGAILDQR